MTNFGSFQTSKVGTIYEDAEKEDPTIYVSDKTGRGPLSSDWIQEHWEACKDQNQPTPEGKGIMCAYKLCKVEFRYWGMQSKIERFIHDMALRKTMLKAHSQAWTWQDEWYGLTMEDIRAIEKETAEILRQTMAEDLDEDGEYKPGFDLESSNQPELEMSSCSNSVSNNTTKAQFSSIEYHEADMLPSLLANKSNGNNMKPRSLDDEDDDEFFDAREQWDEISLAKWSSMELENVDLEQTPSSGSRVASLRDQEPNVNFRRVHSLNEKSLTTPVDPGHPPLSARPHAMSRPIIDVNQCSDDRDYYCPTQVLILVVHGGSVLDGPMEVSVRKSDVTTFRGAFETVMRTHYPGLVGQVVIKCVPCPAVCTEALAVLSSLSPYRYSNQM